MQNRVLENYFINPEESVEVISELILNENWELLTSYYYLQNCTPEIIDSMLSGDYFIQTEKPEIAHPGEFWKYKHPFPPAYNYHYHEDLQNDTVKVNVFIEIDQGDGNIQTGIISFLLIKLNEGYQILPS